ncbi:MAG TPA: hypothetical protein VHK91_14390, partial [Flavisolibacter sp.]|nr:hypothetical protein [Flavisolibacter sp.]
MFSNVGSLLDRLQGLLSKGYLLGGLIPFVLLFFVNWGMVYYVFPDIYHAWVHNVLPPQKEELLYWIKTVLILFTGGLVLWNLNPWLRQWWEGRYLPRGMRRYLSGELSKRFLELETEKKRLALLLFDQRKLYSTLATELAAARKEGSTRPAMDASPELVAALEKLKKKHRKFEELSFDDLNGVKTTLLKELKAGNAEGKTLDKVQARFLDLCREALSYLEYQYDRLQTEWSQQFPGDIGRVGPTTMANFAEVHRDYGLLHYGLDIEHFWLRMLKVIRGDADFYPMLEEAKTQLDFSVAVTSVLFLSSLVWVPLSWMAPSSWTFLLTALLGPIGVIIAYQVAVQ